MTNIVKLSYTKRSQGLKAEKSGRANPIFNNGKVISVLWQIIDNRHLTPTHGVGRQALTPDTFLPCSIFIPLNRFVFVYLGCDSNSEMYFTGVIRASLGAGGE